MTGLFILCHNMTVLSLPGGGEPVKSMNLPNMLSLSRIFLAPLVMLLLTTKIDQTVTPLAAVGLSVTYSDLLAGLVFIVAASTDAVDGYIARRRGLITNLGKFIDPLSDKVLVIAALVALVELHRLPGWMVMVIVARDFVVSGLRMVAAAEGQVIAASRLGKIKTVSQIIAIVMMIFKLPLAIEVMWVSLALTVWSGAVYVANGWDLITDSN
ncbi:CDP-diacylglycerol--glycerol-3-phosphate 3-phosphatidyltransferase [Jonquetella anthropi E3_33 E1]|nr:CDP-diacylglycerol--glycerol-3-phosphate 3-phosphatidyltransferase [Jonquetella anthropi E3_33 E1]